MIIYQADVMLQMLRELMTSAASAGLTVMRTWAHAVSSQYALQPSPGQYNEAVFRGLDWVMDTARQAGIKVRVWQEPDMISKHAQVILLMLWAASNNDMYVHGISWHTWLFLLAVWQEHSGNCFWQMPHRHQYKPLLPSCLCCT